MPNMRIVASSPGDIVIEFKVAPDNKIYVVPVKTLSASKSMETSKEYGVGSHQAYAEVVGKIGYEGDFEIGSWYTSAEENPEKWDELVQLLTYQTDEGLPREFTINVHARSGEGMVRVGTGTYGDSGDGYQGSTSEDGSYIDTSDESYTTLVNNLTSATGGSSNLIIMSYHRCILKGDSVSIGEVGSTISRKYPFSAMYRWPK